MTKQCQKCRTTKQLTDFYPHKENADGLLNKCKTCTKEDVLRNRYAHHSYYLEYDRKRRKKDYVKPVKTRAVKIFSIKWYKTWKGNASEYRKLHYWVERQLGKPNKCENCGKDGLSGRAIHWANKSGNYDKIIGDWQRLCASCHSKKDKKL